MTHRPVPDGARLVTVDASWFPGRPPTGPTAFLATASGLRPGSGAAGETLHLPGTLLPAFTDAHVHLGLVDATELVPHGVAAVHDLGWIPDVAAVWARRTAPPAARLPHVVFAGAFLTAPGGYPSDRAWAPDGSVARIASPEEAVAAVDRQLDAGASYVKVVLNTVAGPVPDDATLAAVVGRAHERGVPVVAHTEGPGQAARAFEAGVDRLAHAPFSERLSDDLIAAMARPGSLPVRGSARRRTRHEGPNGAENDLQVVFGEARTSRMTWVSTLDIHGWGAPTPERDVATDNVRRFVAAGGSVVYGTDLGNGPLPLGVNPRELAALAAAGLGADALLRALTSGLPSSGAVTYVPGPPAEDLARLHLLDGPDELAQITRWLAGAATLHLADVLHPGFAPPSGMTTRKDQP